MLSLERRQVSLWKRVKIVLNDLRLLQIKGVDVCGCSISGNTAIVLSSVIFHIALLRIDMVYLVDVYIFYSPGPRLTLYSKREFVLMSLVWFSFVGSLISCLISCDRRFWLFWDEIYSKPFKFFVDLLSLFRSPLWCVVFWKLR